METQIPLLARTMTSAGLLSKGIVLCGVKESMNAHEGCHQYHLVITKAEKG